MASSALRVDGPGSTFDIRSRNEPEFVVLDLASEGDSLTSLQVSNSSDANLNSVQTIQSQGHSFVLAQTSDCLTNYDRTDHAEDSHTDSSYIGGYIGGPWQRISMSIDGHKPQAFVFRPSYPVDDGTEAPLNKNCRKVSGVASIQDHGPYSGIVRVKAIYEDRPGADSIKRWSWGTGIIIDNQHVMTVAHNVWHKKFGPAITSIIYRDRRADPGGIDRRHDVEIASVHYGWTTTYSKQNDFAILRVSVPFSDKIKPMKYKATMEDSVETTIHGFSSDFPEIGILTYSRAESRYVGEERVVFHDGDTFRGASGGPVVDSDGVVIAIHRGWGERSSFKDRINQAVAINHHGNDVQKFIDILALSAGQSRVGTSGIALGATFVFRAAQVTLVGWD
ncbi:trypsin-like cysteine/serine peptidase domain-containing protein [Xylaria scruposa]|nr:trypsin-like cysteine/serine peptidase domain-containing protein [Xylaria scruposa]